MAVDVNERGEQWQTSEPRLVVLGLGSNLGDRVGNVLSGASAIARCANARKASLSPLYETSPVDGPPQGDYINAALAFPTGLSAMSLLRLALGVEQRHGRVRVERLGPRTLDIDILWVAGEIVDEPDLQVPYPRLLDRAFALYPLLDIVSDAVDPQTGRLFAESTRGVSPPDLLSGRKDGTMRVRRLLDLGACRTLCR